jgi:hypothetical protein
VVLPHKCECRGRERFLAQVHKPAIWQDAAVREIVLRVLHEGCGGRPKVVELVTTVQPPPRVWCRVRLGWRFWTVRGRGWPEGWPVLHDVPSARLPRA